MANPVSSASNVVAVNVITDKGIKTIVKNATDKTVQTVAGKMIPAIKYPHRTYEKRYGHLDTSQEIFIPSIKVIYDDEGRAFFADKAREEKGHTSIELDSKVVDKMHAIAKKAKELVDLKAEMPPVHATFGFEANEIVFE